MGYTLGISSGLYSVGRSKELYGLAKKGYYSLKFGIKFTQIDLDSLSEFKDPFLRQSIEELKRFGIEFGIHGETRMTTGRNLMFLESALETYYKMSHFRLIEHLKNMDGLGAKYLVFHASESTPFSLLSFEEQVSRLVDPWGNPLKNFIKENKFLLDFVFNKNNKVREQLWKFVPLQETDPFEVIKKEKEVIEMRYKEAIEKEEKEEVKKGLEEAMKKELGEVEQRVKEYFLGWTYHDRISIGPERFAYYVVAKYMQETNDPIWWDVVGKKLSDEEIVSNPNIWVPAVAIKYIQGHFNPKNSSYQDPKPYLEKNKLFVSFESAEGTRGEEYLLRIYKPKDLHFLAKHLNTPYGSWVLDFEHTLTNGLDVMKAVEELPDDGGSTLKVVHLAYPSPLHGHMPIPLGSEAQEYIYKVLFLLRQKGFRDGWIIYERGGEPVGQTILTLRKIKEFLEKDVPPEELPPEFYGFDINEPNIVRQQQIIKQHAFDPLKGLITVPEEEHTFLGRRAVERGKVEEWKRGEMK